MSSQALAPMAWVLVSPYAAIAVVGGIGRVRDLVARRYPVCVSLGWLAMAALALGALACDGAAQLAVIAVAAPLTGLAIWVRGGGDWRRGEEPSDPPPAEPTRADCERRHRRRPSIALSSRTRSTAR
jgi:hypothetical protein